MAPFSMRAVLLHATAAAVMAYGYMNLRTVPFDKFIRAQKGGHSQYLTIIGLGMAFMTMIFGLGADVVPSITIFRRGKRVILMIALPVAVVVTTVYWSLYFLMPEMILKPLPDATTPEPDEIVPSSLGHTGLQRIPLRIDLSLHAAPAIALILDFYFVERRYPRSQAIYGSFLACAMACVAYASWVEYLAQFNDSFPYPFLTENPFDKRVIIYAGVSTFALVTFWALNALHA